MEPDQDLLVLICLLQIKGGALWVKTISTTFYITDLLKTTFFILI